LPPLAAFLPAAMSAPKPFFRPDAATAVSMPAFSRSSLSSSAPAWCKRSGTGSVFTPSAEGPLTS
jgi:hypothetical protein